jgi:hypothetical protein
MGLIVEFQCFWLSLEVSHAQDFVLLTFPILFGYTIFISSFKVTKKQVLTTKSSSSITLKKKNKIFVYTILLNF